MTDYSNKEIYKGMLQEDMRVYEYMYRNFFPLYKSDMAGFRLNEDDCYDIFQEAMIILTQNVKSGKLGEDTNFKSYLWSVYRNLWNNFYRKQQSERIKDAVDIDNRHMIDDVSELYEKNLRHRVFFENLEKLHKICRELLELFFDKVPLSKIVKKLGFKNVNSVKTQKYKCKDKLVTLIKADPRFSSISE